MTVRKVNIDKFITILSDFKGKGYKHVSLTIRDERDNYVITVNPVEEELGPSIDTFNIDEL